MRRFEFVDGKSSKFWEISLNGSSFTVRFGRIGTDGQTQEKSYPTAAKALAEHDKLVKEKTGKGYSEVGGAPAAGAEAEAPEAEAEAEAEAPPEPVAATGPRRFEFVDGKSSKFWEIEVAGATHTVRYGRIGSDGQVSTKDFPSAEKARAEAEKLIAEKTGKGYSEIGGPAAAPEPEPTPEAPAEAPAEAEETPATRRFEYVDDKSSKFWEITVSGSGFRVRYGRLGSDGQTQLKDFPSAAKASAEADKLIAEKTGKGYSEVGAPPAKADAGTASPAPKAAKAAPKASARAEVAAPLPAAGGFVDAGGGYGLGIVDGSIVARNDKGKILSSVPKQLKDGDAFEMLEGALELLVAHAAECRETIEGWMLRSLPVPRAVLEAVWIDPDWRKPLDNLVVAGSDTGILRAVEPGKGLGIVNLDGETRWLTDELVTLPHPILLADLDDWRGLLTELGVSQGTAQLFRETFPKPEGDAARKGSISEFSGGNFDLLAQANNEARKLGYRVSGGCAVCRVWEAGAQTEGRYYIGDGDPMYETTTGDLSWVDSKQQGLTLDQVGPVAFSEGMRMASAIYAKRKVEQKGEADV